MSRSATRDPVHGLLLLNKPAGLTSNRALQKVKRLLGARKAGHTGALDPAATGMLPLCFGEATKIAAFLLEADKAYRVVARLGSATDTGDADGRVTETAPVPALGAAGWQRVLGQFVGEIEQVPPMYSALKKDGRRLYELARRGEEVERAARKVRIHDLRLLEAFGDRLVFRVRCSKGTYVRTLVEDLARAAGTVAHTAALHRESVGPFRPEDMIDLAEAERLAAEGPGPLRARLLPVDRGLAGWPEERLGAEAARRFLDGQAVLAGSPLPAPGPVRVYGDGEFLGVGEIGPGGRLRPRRIIRPGTSG
ncbi:MAG TPA: tRNA pseudouridine(55) synthase TruB [Woeseiaceae bacterium]|nr:tRNA pseudouridine(55) synthase TruB [Woeseiaceae bacterium]